MTSNSSELWVFDLDRTLVNTDRTFDAFVTACTNTGGIEEDSLLEVKQATEKSGGSFDVLGYLGTIGVSSDKLQSIYQEFAENASGNDLLYPDSQPLLNALDDQGVSSLILTYGSEDWQTLKLRATGLIDRPYIITSYKNKGDMITSWRKGKNFEVTDAVGGLLVARTINLVDDKSDSFNGLPVDCRGYLIRRSGEKSLISQVGPVPQNVTAHRDLLSLVPMVNAHS